jgi:hypothetical protein
VPAAYRFLDRWVVPYPIEDVYDLLGEIVAYPEWWPDVFLEADGDAGAPEPGKRADLRTRGYLPYRLRYSMKSSRPSARPASGRLSRETSRASPSGTCAATATGRSRSSRSSRS